MHNSAIFDKSRTPLVDKQIKLCLIESWFWYLSDSLSYILASFKSRSILFWIIGPKKIFQIIMISIFVLWQIIVVFTPLMNKGWTKYRRFVLVFLIVNFLLCLNDLRLRYLEKNVKQVVKIFHFVICSRTAHLEISIFLTIFNWNFIFHNWKQFYICFQSKLKVHLGFPPNLGIIIKSKK